MIRLFVIGLASLSLTACAQRYEPVRTVPRAPDVPDAALVAPCDVFERDPANNEALADELAATRQQRDDCASKVAGLAQWRRDALKRAEALASPK